MIIIIYSNIYDNNYYYYRGANLVGIVDNMQHSVPYTRYLSEDQTYD